MSVGDLRAPHIPVGQLLNALQTFNRWQLYLQPVWLWNWHIFCLRLEHRFSNDSAQYGQGAPSATPLYFTSARRQCCQQPVRNGNCQHKSAKPWSVPLEPEDSRSIMEWSCEQWRVDAKLWNAISVRNCKNAEIEIIWPRAETVRRQTCLCSHELVPGRWQKKKRRTTTDLAYVTCRVSMSHESNMDRSKENSQWLQKWKNLVIGCSNRNWRNLNLSTVDRQTGYHASRPDAIPDAQWTLSKLWRQSLSKVVEKHCQSWQLSNDQLVDCSKWRKLTKDIA